MKMLATCTLTNSETKCTRLFNLLNKMGGLVMSKTESQSQNRIFPLLLTSSTDVSAWCYKEISLWKLDCCAAWWHLSDIMNYPWIRYWILSLPSPKYSFGELWLQFQVSFWEFSSSTAVPQKVNKLYLRWPLHWKLFPEPTFPLPG